MVFGESEQAFGGGPSVRREKRGAELFPGGLDFVCEVFKRGEVADELQDERHVGVGGGADEQRHVF